MKAATAPETLEVDALRVGMYVQLDGGWMSHPFPLSDFRIVSADQIATLRSLGLERVRWSREQSDPAVRDLASQPPTPGDPAAPVDFSDEEPTTQAAIHPVDSSPGDEGPTSADTAAPGPPSDAAVQGLPARRAHRARLAAQAAALQVCERQFAEAAADCRRLTDLVTRQPQEARRQAEALAGALASKMLIKGELCIRLLSDAAGDKASVHAMNVALVSMLMGRSFGMAEADLLDLGTGAMLHDIGKLELPDRVRHPDEHFNGAETRLYEEHVAHGVAFARKMGLSPGATLVIAQHHERSNGEGFPLRLTGDRMTAAARIVALVDRYDRLCNPWHPGRALTPHESLSLLFAQGQTMFDTAILGAFIKMMGVYPAGSTVQLTDDRYAMVVGVNPARPLRPQVLVHDPAVPREEALHLDLERVSGLGIRRSVRPLMLSSAARDYLSPRPRVAYFFESLTGDSLAA